MYMHKRQGTAHQELLATGYVTMINEAKRSHIHCIIQTVHYKTMLGAQRCMALMVILQSHI